jgi:hypothetical protein
MEIDSVKWKWNSKEIFSVYVELVYDQLTSDDEELSYKHLLVVTGKERKSVLTKDNMLKRKWTG